MEHSTFLYSLRRWQVAISSRESKDLLRRGSGKSSCVAAPTPRSPPTPARRSSLYWRGPPASLEQAWASEEADVEGPFSREDVATVAEVIAARRSVRSFTDIVPPREALEQILAAGLVAPYAAAMAPGATLDRRFFVLPRGSAALQAAAATIKAHALEALGEGELPAPLCARLGPIAQGRIPGVGTAPYHVVVAERGSVMAVLQQSLAHTLENM
jgi:hypothetical protein